MKPIFIFYIILLLSVVISCTVQNYRTGHNKEIPIINQQLPTIPTDEKIVVAAVHISVRDSSKELASTTPEQVTVVQQLDTAVLKKWFENMHTDPKYRTSIMDDMRVQAVLSQFVATLDENEAMVRQINTALEEKEKAEKTARLAKCAIYEVPTIFFLMALMFTPFAIMIIYKQHYSRVKLEKQIESIKSYRRD